MRIEDERQSDNVEDRRGSSAAAVSDQFGASRIGGGSLHSQRHSFSGSIRVPCSACSKAAVRARRRP